LTKLDFNIALVAYSEIALKSEPVRRRLESLLAGQIGSALRMREIPFQKVHRTHGRIYIFTPNPVDAAAVAAQVFGVQYTAPALQVSTTLGDIKKSAVKVAEATLSEGQSFAVRARRVGEHPYTSRDLCVEVGNAVLRHLGKKLALKVSLNRPEAVIYIEARERNAYIYTQILRGVGGLPFGSQGKIVALLSSETSSALATWLMMKRGTCPLILSLDAPTHWGDKHRGTVLQLAGALRRYIPYRNFKVEIVPFDSIIEAVEKANRGLSLAVQQRAAVQMACEVAKAEGALGLVVDATFGSSAPQALKMLSLLTQVSERPLFHPLIGFQDDELKKLAERVGLPEVSTTDHNPLTFRMLGDYGLVKSSEAERLEGKVGLKAKLREALNNRTAVKVQPEPS